MGRCTFLKNETEEQTKCCQAHDRHYVKGDVTKFQADKELFKCFWDNGNKVLAVLAFIGVSTVGWYYWLGERWK